MHSHTKMIIILLCKMNTVLPSRELPYLFGLMVFLTASPYPSILHATAEFLIIHAVSRLLQTVPHVLFTHTSSRPTRDEPRPVKRAAPERQEVNSSEVLALAKTACSRKNHAHHRIIITIVLKINNCNDQTVREFYILDSQS